MRSEISRVLLQTYVALFFGVFDHFRSLRRRLDVGWWRNSFWRCSPHELVHVVEIVVVDFTFETYALVVCWTDNNGVGLRRSRIWHLDRNELERIVDVRQTVQ